MERTISGDDLKLKPTVNNEGSDSEGDNDKGKTPFVVLEFAFQAYAFLLL